MPTDRLSTLARTAVLALAACAPSAWAQNSPYYIGGSLGYTRVSNLYRLAASGNDDNVTTLGLLAGLDQRLGRQRLSVDASLQNNRYSRNAELNNQAYSLRSALDWQTLANLSGTLSANATRSLADFNIGGGVEPIFKKNTERNETYAAVARLGVSTRYTVELGHDYRNRGFSAAEYDRFVFHENTTSLGAYATPGADLKLGLAGRYHSGSFPRYPIFFLGFAVGNLPNDYTRKDFDLTGAWTPGGATSANARISRSRTRNSLSSVRDFTGTTGAIGLGWQATAKLALQAQLSRDTGQESQARVTDINRLYRSAQFNASYALSGKIALTGSAAAFRSTARSTEPGLYDGFDSARNYSLGARWIYSRAVTLSCQYTRASRDSSTPQYAYSSNSTGCFAQAMVY